MDIQSFYKKYFIPGCVSTDSRTIRNGDIFVALQGDNFNGNNYAEAAIKAGAKVAIIDDPKYSDLKNTLFVDNSLNFLHELAVYHRQQCAGHFIGLTGTNGKTTTKELIHAILSEKYSCQATQGNLNNHIGVPLTVLSVGYDTEVAIIEMGANHIGEIENLCKISQPDSGLITNIGKAHMEGFGSMEGIKQAKSELYHYLKHNNRTIYINGSDITLLQLLGDYKNVVCYGDKTDFCDGMIIDSANALQVRITHREKSVIIHSNLHGKYNFDNIVTAACIGLHFNLTLEYIKLGLEKYQPLNQRSQLLIFNTTKVVLDCYNANPTSMKAAIKSFLAMPSEKKIAILGEMKELGEYSSAEHLSVGKLLTESTIDRTFLIGEEFEVVKLNTATNLSDVTEIKDYLLETDLRNTAILVKGSRANKLERILEFFHFD